MNRLQFLLSAKNQYAIQSPFLFGLYDEVLSRPLSRADCARLGIAPQDRYAQLRHKLADHYRATPADKPPVAGADDWLVLPDGTAIGLMHAPHRNHEREHLWEELYGNEAVSLSVDLFYAGLVFTTPKLSRQHVLLR